MCGIAGLFDPDASPIENDLAAMNDCLAHRGPDSAAIHRNGSVGLAHRRLSIIDLETGDQPIFNEDGDVVVVYNGEIYNYRALRADLGAAGHHFSTATDTEVLVHGYEEYGLDVLDHIEGMFAFALWDASAERLLLARDPMGIKPLFLARVGDRVAFGSELPALLAAPLDHGGLDRHALAQYFAVGYVPAPRTAFSNVRKLRPGERAVITADRSSDGDTHVDREQYWTPSIQAREPSLDAAAAELRTRVTDAVAERLQSDVPLGAFLSGGLDSSTVVAAMASAMDEPVRTFTVGFGEERFDESWAAREVAEYHDTDHTEYTVTPDDVRELVPTVLDRLGQPFADQSLLPTYVVARETSRDVTVALSGDGADELFAGYDKYRGEYLSGFYRAVPRPLRAAVVEPAVGRLPASRSSALGDLGRKAQRFTRAGESDLARRHLGWMRIGSEETLAAFLDVDPADAAFDTIQDHHDAVEAWLPPERRDDLTRVQAVDTRFSLPDQMLTKVDRASMYNSLEVRVPFLDPSVVEYAFSLPREYKLTVRDRKRVLRRAFDDVIPDSILERDKQGFDMPIGEWFKDELADEFRTAISGLETDLLDIHAVFDLYDEHAAGQRDHAKFLWSVYVFAKWLRRMREQGILD